MIYDFDPNKLALIYFVYGLAFFCMGFAIALEGRRGTDVRLKLALRPLAAFGFLHGLHEWMDMYGYLGLLSQDFSSQVIWNAIKLAILSFSFLSLAAFGSSSLARNPESRRISFLIPLIMATIWSFAIFSIRGDYGAILDLQKAADVLTRYLLGIPSALIASAGLLAQQRSFRRDGLAKFGRDSLIAAIAFAWYGVAGQLFVRSSRLFPSTFINEELFFYWFHFPIQLLRAILAVIVSVYVIRFLRSFDTEIEREIQSLQKAKLGEAKRREKLRGQLLQRVVTAQETERKRVARELHDETGQMLTAIGMGLSSLNTSLSKNVKKSRSILKELEGLVANSIIEVQRLISNLRPSQLDDLGLPAALRWYLGERSEHAENISIYFSQVGESFELRSSVKIALFRIVQEAITNILKHSQASRANVNLIYGKNNIEVEVKDNGIGLTRDLRDFSGKKSWGLLGMRERAKLLGGTCDIQSKTNEGVLVRVLIPINEKENKVE